MSIFQTTYCRIVEWDVDSSRGMWSWPDKCVLYRNLRGGTNDNHENVIRYVGVPTDIKLGHLPSDSRDTLSLSETAEITKMPLVYGRCIL